MEYGPDTLTISDQFLIDFMSQYSYSSSDNLKENLKSLSVDGQNILFSTVSQKEHTRYTSILLHIFYNYIEYINNKKNNKLFIKNAIFFSKNRDSRILDVYNEIVDDIMSIDSINSNISINLIGGKMSDYLSGKSFDDSDGDYDLWIVGADPYLINDLLIRNSIFTYNQENSTHRYSNFTKSFFGKEIKIQLILAEFEFIEDVFNKFDFLHCCIGYDGKYIFWRKGALSANDKKEILINRIYSSTQTNERLNKYISRGFTITYPQMVLISISTLFSLENISFNESLFTKLKNKNTEDFQLFCPRTGYIVDEEMGE